VLDHDLVVVTPGERDGRLEPRGPRDEREAHRRSLLGRLHDRRPPEVVTDVRRGRGRHQPGGDLDSGRPHHALREVLVHGERARERTAAGVGDPDGLEQGLDRATLAAASVQTEEDHVRAPDRGQGGESLGEEAPLGAVQGGRIGRGADRRRQYGRLRLGGERAGDAVDDGDRVAPRAQRRHHRRGAGERDRPLGSRAAGQDGDPHQRIPAS